MIPPMTTVSSSLTITLELASRVSSSGTAAPEDVDPRELELTVICIRIKPSLNICGVTVRVMPTGMASVATAVPAAAAEPLAMLVVPLGTLP